MMIKISRHISTLSLLPLLFSGIFLLLMMIGFFWQPYDIYQISIANRFAKPNVIHWLGTDYLGRDILSLLLYGMGQSLVTAFLSIVPIVFVAVILGFIAAQDTIPGKLITAFSDFLFAFPVIIVAIFLTAHFGPGRYVPIVSIALFALPVLIKITRSQIFTLKSADFIEASLALGISRFALFFKHYLPNIHHALLVQLALLTSVSILTEAGLSYLGFGGALDQPSLGRLLFDAQRLAHIAPHMVVFPGLIMVLIVMNINWLADFYNDGHLLIELRS